MQCVVIFKIKWKERNKWKREGCSQACWWPQHSSKLSWRLHSLIGLVSLWGWVGGCRGVEVIFTVQFFTLYSCMLWLLTISRCSFCFEFLCYILSGKSQINECIREHKEAGVMFRGNPGFSSWQLGLNSLSCLSGCFIVCGRLRFVTFPEMVTENGVCVFERHSCQLDATPTVRKYDHWECRSLQKPQLKSPTECSNTAVTLRSLNHNAKITVRV